MRRSIPIIVATAGGAALLAGFHTSRIAPLVALPASQPATTLPPAPGDTSGTAAPTTTAPAGSNRTVDGPVIGTDYGDVQVRVTFNGTKIVDVQAVQLPYDRSRSQRLSQRAGPVLRTEALRAQSASIDVVSGASYTSEAYAESLQGAIDQSRQ